MEKIKENSYTPEIIREDEKGDLLGADTNIEKQEITDSNGSNKPEITENQNETVENSSMEQYSGNDDSRIGEGNMTDGTGTSIELP